MSGLTLLEIGDEFLVGGVLLEVLLVVLDQLLDVVDQLLLRELRLLLLRRVAILLLAVLGGVGDGGLGGGVLDGVAATVACPSSEVAVALARSPTQRSCWFEVALVAGHVLVVDLVRVCVHASAHDHAHWDCSASLLVHEAGLVGGSALDGGSLPVLRAWVAAVLLLEVARVVLSDLHRLNELVVLRTSGLSVPDALDSVLQCQVLGM